MRLTAELIKGSPSYLNPIKDRELDLRGHRITAIENLGVAGPHDAIDFTDNDIQVLGNFPLSPRIRTLLLARNRISSIQTALPISIPNLTNLVLATNNINELADVDVLGSFPRLTHLVLKDNPVAKKEHYRYWILWKCPSVRFLDYVKVRQAERERAAELFGTSEEPTALASTIMGQKSTALDLSANGSAGQLRMSKLKLTDKEKKLVQERIKNTASLQEILFLEKELEEGRLPSGIQADVVGE